MMQSDLLDQFAIYKKSPNLKIVLNCFLTYQTNDGGLKPVMPVIFNISSFLSDKEYLLSGPEVKSWTGRKILD